MSLSDPVSIQEVSNVLGGLGLRGAALQYLTMTVAASLIDIPAYWSMARDNEMADFVKRPGNDLLAGAVSTLVSRVAATPVYFEGPLSLALFYRNSFFNESDITRGWTDEIEPWVEGFLVRDAGGTLELMRSGPGDLYGPALGIKHLDESMTQPTGDPEYPLLYTRLDGKIIKVHRSQARLLVDMPEGRDKYLGVGFSSVSRALSTAHILMDIVRYKRERLSDLPPAAVMFINNMVPKQWEKITSEYDVRQRNEGNQVWRDVLVAFGLDPAYPVTAELFEFSQLPEGYNDKDFTSMAMFSFALAFRVDPREFWPVSGGPLGTAHEADIQDRKAKSKGEGVIFAKIERAFNQPNVLPPSVTFRFDYRDTEEDRAAAEIRSLHIQNVRRLWEKSLKAAPTPSKPEDEDQDQDKDEERDDEEEQEEEEETRATSLVEPDDAFMGMISTEEARSLLVLWDIVPPEILGQRVTLDRVYDVRTYGPMARVYSDGRVVLRK